MSRVVDPASTTALPCRYATLFGFAAGTAPAGTVGADGEFDTPVAATPLGFRTGVGRDVAHPATATKIATDIASKPVPRWFRSCAAVARIDGMLIAPRLIALTLRLMRTGVPLVAERCDKSSGDRTLGPGRLEDSPEN